MFWVRMALEAKSSSASWRSENFSEGGVGEVADAFGDEGVIDDVSPLCSLVRR